MIIPLEPKEPSLYERVGGRSGIARLVKHFYADVRQHNLIGPVFNERIHDWQEHLAKIEEFWSRVTGGPSDYFGNVPAKHLELNLAPAHFAAWLGLWEANCVIYLPPAEAAEMIATARQIGRRLQGGSSLL